MNTDYNHSMSLQGDCLCGNSLEDQVTYDTPMVPIDDNDNFVVDKYARPVKYLGRRVTVECCKKQTHMGCLVDHLRKHGNDCAYCRTPLTEYASSVKSVGHLRLR